MATVYKIRPVKLVGRKIRQLRKQHNLTQTELSSRIGIQQSDLSRMEKGEYRVSLDTLFRLLGEFRMGIGEFFDQMARESLNERDLNLLQDFQTLDEPARREVEELIATKQAHLPQDRQRGLRGASRGTAHRRQALEGFKG